MDVTLKLLDLYYTVVPKVLLLSLSLSLNVWDPAKTRNFYSVILQNELKICVT